MLKVRSDIIQSIREAKQAADLYQYLQSAVELEHSTIPPYLQAYYSIRRDSQLNKVAATLIRSIVVQEMLHMLIVANILNAIDGRPAINTPGFIPNYPSPLPMNVHEGLTVGLSKISKPVIHDVFMEIEAPEDPQHYPIKLTEFAQHNYATIGLFYATVADKLRELGNGIFTGNPGRQVVDNGWFPADQLFPIKTLDDAVRGIDVIVRQGEGTTKSPLDGDGELAHYYRFAEVYYGRYLIPDKTVNQGYSYSGAPIPLEPAGIWDMVANPKLSDYPERSPARARAERFNGIYTNLLNSLHLTVNGVPQHLGMAIGGMYELRLAAEALIEIKLPSGKQAAPTFQYALQNA